MTLVPQPLMRLRLPAPGANGDVLTVDGGRWVSGPAGGGATDTDSVTNNSVIVPVGGSLTDALNTADTRIDAAAADAATAQTDATQALADAASAQTDADAALSGLATKQDLIPPGAAGNFAISDGSGWVSTPAATLLFGRGLPFFLECVTDPAASGLARSTVGTGQILASSAYATDHPGQWTLQIGAGSASRAALFLGPSAGGLITPNPSTSGQWEVMLQVPTTSGGGQTFELFCGFADGGGASSVTNGVYFFVSAANSLIARRTVGGVHTDTVVGSLSAGAWYRLRATYSGGNTILSYVQSANRSAPLTTVLTSPVVGAAQSPQIKILRTGGATTRSINIDYIAWYFPST